MRREDFDALWTSDDPRERDRARELARTDEDCARWAEWAVRLEQTARELRPRAPEGVLDEVLRRMHTGAEDIADSAPPVLATPPPRALRLLGPAVVLIAAGLLVLLLNPDFLSTASTPSEHPAEGPAEGLLSDAGLHAAERRQLALADQHSSLIEQLDQKPSPPIVHSPLHEEVRFLDEAIGELEHALAGNRKHEHLRHRLLELSDRRNDLLARLAGEVGG